jgi:hypothetical protein
MGPITTAIYSAIKPHGVLIHEGFMVKCAGTLDAEGNSVDRHLIVTLASHLPGADAHAWGNPEFTDSLWEIDPAQSAIDWNSPKCCICQQELAP